MCVTSFNMASARFVWFCFVAHVFRRVRDSQIDHILFTFFFCGAATQRGAWPPRSWGFLDHTQRRTTVGRTALDEWSARHRDLYLTTHNTHNRQTSMPPVGFELTISAGERPQTYALDRAATGTGVCIYIYTYIYIYIYKISFRKLTGFRLLPLQVLYGLSISTLFEQLSYKRWWVVQFRNFHHSSVISSPLQPCW